MMINRKKFLKYIGLSALLTFFSLNRLSFLEAKPKKKSFKKNNSLNTVKENYNGNPFVNGKFVNMLKKPKISVFDVIKWRFSKNPQAKEFKEDKFKLDIVYNNKIFDIKEDVIIWLGHASFFIRLDGKNILIDPCFSDLLFVKRLSNNSCSIKDIKNIDYLLISHSHLDHLDSTTVEKANFEGTKALIPLSMGKVIKKMNKKLNYEEAGWFQKFNTDKNGPEIYLMPSQHWSRRSINDENETLWGSYILKGKSKTIFFAGDSALFPGFKMINKVFSDIDICLMPVGAYKPSYIMKGSHMSPEESVKAFNQLKGKIFFPMHYGTYVLSDEPPGEPVRKLNKLASRKKIKGSLMIKNPGEIIKL